MRLTKTSDNFGGMVWFRSQDRNDLWLEPCEMTAHDSRRAIDELAAYEDAEEQGLLVRLPCKVGDTLYEPLFNSKRVLEYKIIRILLLDTEIHITACHYEYNMKKYEELVYIWQIGKKFFLTREEAEAALKEELECQIQDKHGKWINPHWQSSMHCMNCNQCKYEAQHSVYHGVEKYYHYCPNCGARMDGTRNE